MYPLYSSRLHQKPDSYLDGGEELALLGGAGDLPAGYFAVRLGASVLQRDLVAHLPVHLHQRHQHLARRLQALLAVANAQGLQGHVQELHRHGKLRAVGSTSRKAQLK